MKIVIAPDKYKGNMTSPELCEIIRKEFQSEMPEAEIICIPLADGGDGTTEAVRAYQQARGLRVSGIANMETQKALDEEYTRKYESDSRIWTVVDDD